MIIPVEQYKQTIETLPILCVDLLLQNNKGQYLLLLRKNEPLKGKWWIPGGRIHKGESVLKAAERKCREEVGIKSNSFNIIGLYEGHFEEAPFGVKSGVHVLSIILKANIDGAVISLDDQSAEWKFSKELPVQLKIQSFQIGVSP